jgi:hypothetical protein
MSWLHDGETINKISDLSKKDQKAFGFIYCIVLNHGGKSYEYYGRKNFFSTRTKRASNKQLKEKGKSAFRRKKQKKGKNSGEWYYYESVRTEMKWKDYNSSSKEVLEKIKNGAQFTKYIVQIVQEECMMNYFEAKHQFCSGVLESEKFLNGNILGRFHKKNIINKK